jgi:hypothetical protein
VMQSFQLREGLYDESMQFATKSVATSRTRITTNRRDACPAVRLMSVCVHQPQDYLCLLIIEHDHTLYNMLSDGTDI